VGSETNLQINGQGIAIKTTTDYPLNGHIKMEINANGSNSFSVHLRKPGWSDNTVVPGGLYHYAMVNKTAPSILVNGKPITANLVNGYYEIERKWKKEM